MPLVTIAVIVLPRLLLLCAINKC